MGTLDLPRNLHNVGNTREKRGFSARGTSWQLHLQQLGPCMWCGVTPLQGLSPPAPPGLENPTHKACGLCKKKREGQPPQEWEILGLWGWWLGGAVQGLQQMERWPGDACPSVPAVSQPPAAAQQLLLGPIPHPKLPCGLLSPCVLPLSLCSSSAARGDDSLSPRLGPAALVPTARADKEALEGLGTAGKGPGQAQGHGRDVAENQGTVARPGTGTVFLGMGTGAWPAMRTASLRMGTRAWLAGNGDRSVTRDGWGQGPGCARG